MSDLVERLRQGWQGLGPGDLMRNTDRAMNEAANEIERLRKELEEEEQTVYACMEEIKRLRRENEVMKAADYEALTKPAT